MILIVDDPTLWKEFVSAKRALAEHVEPLKSAPSHFETSLEKIRLIDRLARARRALSENLRIAETKDRFALFAETDAVRARPETKGPKPQIKDPLTER